MLAGRRIRMKRELYAHSISGVGGPDQDGFYDTVVVASGTIQYAARRNRSASTELRMDAEPTHPLVCEHGYACASEPQDRAVTSRSHLKRNTHLPQQGSPPPEYLTTPLHHATCHEAPEASTLGRVPIEKLLLAAPVAAVLEVQVPLAMPTATCLSTHTNASSIPCIGQSMGGGYPPAGCPVEAESSSVSAHLGEDAGRNTGEQPSCIDPVPKFILPHTQRKPQPTPQLDIYDCSSTDGMRFSMQLCGGTMKPRDPAGCNLVPTSNLSTSKSSQPLESIRASTGTRVKKRVRFARHAKPPSPPERPAPTINSPKQQHSIDPSSRNVHRTTTPPGVEVDIERPLKRSKPGTTPNNPSPLRNVVLNEDPTGSVASPPEESSNTISIGSSTPRKEIIYVFKETAEMEDTEIPDWVKSRRKLPPFKACVSIQGAGGSPSGADAISILSNIDETPGHPDLYDEKVADAVMRHMEEMD